MTFDERWPGDPYPAAFEKFRSLRDSQSAAWQAVADEAQREANAARSVRIHFRNGRKVEQLVAAAKAYEQPTHDAHVAVVRAEHARRPR